MSLISQAKYSRKASGHFTLIGGKVAPAARDSSEVARALNQRCYLHTTNVGHSWYLSGSLSLSVRFSTQDETMDVAGSRHMGLIAMRTLMTCFLNWE